jgi:hypothetical protein
MIKPTPVPWVRIGTTRDYAVRIVVDAVTMSTRIISVKSGGMAMAVKPRISRSSDPAFKPITPIVVPMIRIMRKYAYRPKYCSQNERHENFTHDPIPPFCFYRLRAKGNVNCRTGKSTPKISLDRAGRVRHTDRALRLGKAHFTDLPLRAAKSG